MVCVTDLTSDYLVAIGAVGMQVDLDAVAPLDASDIAGELDAGEENL